MPIPSTRMRANRYWFIIYTAVSAAALIWGIVFGIITAAPAFWYAMVPLIVGIGFAQFALAWTGHLLPYVRITPYQLTCRPGPPLLLWWTLSTTVRIDHGDVLVATDQQLILYKYYGGAYLMPVNRLRTYPGDWERMQAWVAAMWPQRGPVGGWTG